MKKLIFAILSLGLLLTSNASADGYCPNWEHGQIITDDQPNGSIPPLPYCWQVSNLEGIVYHQGQLLQATPDIFHVSGIDNSVYDFIALDVDYAYGSTEYYGIYVFVEVYGLPQNTPSVSLNNHFGVLKETTNIYSQSGSIINGHKYKFFIPYIPVDELTYYHEIDINGVVKIYDGATLKEQFPFRVY